MSGLGAIDYKRIYDNSDIKLEIKGRASYNSLKDIADPDKDGKKAAIRKTCECQKQIDSLHGYD